MRKQNNDRKNGREELQEFGGGGNVAGTDIRDG